MPWGKQWLSVEGLQVPLIINGPLVQPGGVEERLVSLIDLAPSLLARAGLPVPAWMEGRPILSGEFPHRAQVFAARDRCGDAQDRIRAVITPNRLFVRNFDPALSRLNWSGYKEASYPGMPLLRVLLGAGKLNPLQTAWMEPRRAEIELYDLRNDPSGLNNLAGDTGQRAAIAGLRRTMDEWIAASGDRGALPDPATEPSLEQIKTSKRADYQRTWKARLQKPEPTDAERLAWWEERYGLQIRNTATR
jgi:uncharacterized sulfatase